MERQNSVGWITPTLFDRHTGSHSRAYSVVRLRSSESSFGTGPRTAALQATPLNMLDHGAIGIHWTAHYMHTKLYKLWSSSIPWPFATSWTYSRIFQFRLCLDCKSGGSEEATGHVKNRCDQVSRASDNSEWPLITGLKGQTLVMAFNVYFTH
jgi:hypothetical protein